MLPEFFNQDIVVDTETRLTYVGRLIKVDDRSSPCLENVTIYDDQIIRVPLEQYLIECAAHGFAPVRKLVWVNPQKIVSVSLLNDIIVPGRQDHLGESPSAEMIDRNYCGNSSS